MAGNETRLPGFAYTTVPVAESSYSVAAAGDGRAVLMLHGFPQDHTCWHRVAPALARDDTVVLCDLKGIGASRAPRGGPLGEGYAKRDIAGELVEVMARAGHERFAVVGHDRGARVAYRMALDDPECVERLCVLNVIPTAEQFDRLDADSALEYWPFLLLAQPAPFAEKLIAAAAAEHVVRHVLDTWTASPGAIDSRAALRARVHARHDRSVVRRVSRRVPPRSSTRREGPRRRANDRLPAASPCSAVTSSLRRPPTS